MIQHDRLVGEGLGQAQQVVKLGLKQPGIEGQPALAQFGKALTERAIKIEPGGMVERRAEHIGIGIPCRGMADTAKTATTSGGKRIEHGACVTAKGQIGMADDRMAQPLAAIEPAGPLRGHAVDVFDFAHNLQRITGPSLVECAAFHEDRADDVVPAGRVGVQLVEGVIGR